MLIDAFLFRPDGSRQGVKQIFYDPHEQR
jgi:hypothetical protein